MVFETVVAEDPSAQQRLTALSQIGDMFSKLIFGLNPPDESISNIIAVFQALWPRIRKNADKLLVSCISKQLSWILYFIAFSVCSTSV